MVKKQTNIPKNSPDANKGGGNLFKHKRGSAPDSQEYHKNHLINIVDYIVVFIGLKILHSTQVHFTCAQLRALETPRNSAQFENSST